LTRLAPETFDVGNALDPYVFDNAVAALRNLRQGSAVSALLFLPNIVRAFFVLVMSSSAGATIGVTEAVAVIVRETQQLPASTASREKPG
jgi:hypothetical protein